MATFNTVWSLDLGRSSLKAVKLRRERNNIEILQVDKVDYLLGADGVDSATQAKEALAAFRSRNEIREPVIVAHNGQGTLSRFIKIPVSDPKKVDEMVGYEAAQQIPFPLDEVIWDYHVIDRDYMPGEEREVGIFAARRDAIDDYLLDFQGEDLDVEGVAIGYLGLLNFILYDVAPEEPTVFLDIGASHTDLILVDGKKFWTRALPFSGDEITKAIMERFKLNFSEAEKIKLQSAKNQKQALKIFTAVIQPKLRDLVNETHRSIGYYRSQSGEVQFKQLYLLGNASKVLGIKKFLEEHLNMPVQRLQSISRLRVSRDANLKLLQAHLPAFATAFGAALQGVGVGSCRVDLLPQEEKMQKEVGRKKKHVFIALAALYLVTALGGWIIKGKIDSAQAEFDDTGDALNPITLADKELKKIPIEDITDRSQALEAIARLRGKPVEALDMLGQVLSALPNAQTLKIEAENEEAKKREALTALVRDSRALMEKKLWVPWFKIEKIELPEDEKKRTSRTKIVVNRPNTVKAYKISAYAVIVRQANVEESLNVVKERLGNPIKKLLDGRTTEAEVTYLNAGDIDTIWLNVKSGSTRGPRGAKKTEDLTQEGGPFYGAEVQWTLCVDELPEEGKAEELAADQKK